MPFSDNSVIDTALGEGLCHTHRLSFEPNYPFIFINDARSGEAIYYINYHLANMVKSTIQSIPPVTATQAADSLIKLLSEGMIEIRNNNELIETQKAIYMILEAIDLDKMTVSWTESGLQKLEDFAEGQQL